MRFYYRLHSDEGDEISGEIEAPSRLEALRRLASRGWHVDYCDTRPPEPQAAPESPAMPSADKGLRIFPLFLVIRPWPGHLATFYHQLGQLLGAGVSPHEAALRLAQHAPNPYLRLIMAEIAPALADGESLAENLARYPQFFPPDAIGLLRAAERSGDWEGICRDLENWYTQAYRGGLWFIVLRLYYAAVLVLALLVPYFPYIVSRGVRWYLRFALTHIVPIIAGLLLAWLIWRIFTALPATRPMREAMAASVPLLRSMTYRRAAARFLRALAALLRAGIEPAEALELAAPATGNWVLERQVMRAAEAVRRGQQIDEAAAGLRFLDSRQRSVLATAFAAGRLDEGLALLASQASDAAAASARLARFSTQSVLFIVISVVGAAAVVIGYLNLYRSLAEAAGASDLLEELFRK